MSEGALRHLHALVSYNVKDVKSASVTYHVRTHSRPKLLFGGNYAVL